MNTFDLSPLYRTSVGFDQLSSLLNSVSANDRSQSNYPPYNIEVLNDDQYRITMAVAGFVDSEIKVETEHNTLTVSTKKPETKTQHNYLHQGIAARNFNRQFKLAEHVEVVSANTENGLLHIELLRTIPEALKPRQITLNAEALGNTEKRLKSA